MKPWAGRSGVEVERDELLEENAQLDIDRLKLAAECGDLRKQLARLTEGMPTAEDFAGVYISVGGGETKTQKVVEWLNKLTASDR
jgi:hypothetical protein